MISFIGTAIIISFIGTALSGCVALFGARESRVASWALCFSGIAGAAGSLAFLFFSSAPLIVMGPLPFAFGLTFSLTTFSSLFYALLSVVVALTGFFGTAYLRHYQKTYTIRVVQLLTSAFVFGMEGVLLSSNVLGFLFFWEMMSLSSFFLVMSDRKPESIRAAMHYFVMTHAGAMALFAAFLLLGHVALAAPVAGILANADVSPHVAILAALLFLFGFGSKAGLVPLHLWLPEAHPQAPSHISALMSGLMLTMAVYGFVMTVGNTNQPAWYGLLVIGLGALSAVYGVLYAVVERDIKRLLAYSSIENMGLIFLMLGMHLYFQAQGIFSLSTAALTVAIFHALNHGLFKSGLFLAAGTIIRHVHTRSMEYMGGLARRMPFFSFLLLLLALSGAAIPPFGTFFGEWGMIHSLVATLQISSLAFVDRGVLLFALSIFALVGGLAIFAMVKFFAIPMLGQARSDEAMHAEKPEFAAILPIGILAALVLCMGFGATAILNRMGSGDFFQSVYGAESTVAPANSWLVWIACFFALVVANLLRHLFKTTAGERIYQTWDCGQPITSGMAYTGTAFSAPIRFFFRFLLRIRKTVTSTPVVSTNPWIKTYATTLDLRSFWHDRLYHPAILFLHSVNASARKIQSGHIQHYVLFVFIALVLTMVIAL